MYKVFERKKKAIVQCFIKKKKNIVNNNNFIATKKKNTHIICDAITVSRCVYESVILSFTLAAPSRNLVVSN